MSTIPMFFSFYFLFSFVFLLPFIFQLPYTFTTAIRCSLLRPSPASPAAVDQPQDIAATPPPLTRIHPPVVSCTRHQHRPPTPTSSAGSAPTARHGLQPRHRPPSSMPPAPMLHHHPQPPAAGPRHLTRATQPSVASPLAHRRRLRSPLAGGLSLLLCPVDPPTPCPALHLPVSAASPRSASPPRA
jgi:hypothetical protein